ncbi:hypothetical protein [Nostoc sp.]|uniref:hypothetical protein n=1 Tax=Nostoc sp. TaxID=1180 RepID=UPI002FFD2E5E
MLWISLQQAASRVEVAHEIYSRKLNSPVLTRGILLGRCPSRTTICPIIATITPAHRKNIGSYTKDTAQL